MFDFFKENKEVQKLISTRYQVIFYAEGAYYFQYFKYIFDELRAKGVKLAYITSDKKDPVFEMHDELTTIIYSKSTLAFALGRLQADVVIMTMPGLDQYIYKRSAGVKKYVYVFHALVSTHQQYPAHSFDAFDAIFLTGPEQESEIRETEMIYGLPEKELVPFGYPLLEELIEKKAVIASHEQQILIAPSWYEEGIFQSCIHQIINVLAGTGYQVLIRPHPEYIKRNKKSFEQLQSSTRKFSNIRLDTSPSLWESLVTSAYLITDRSGIAFEFAFVNNRPVIFIDTPLKVRNQEFNLLKALPVENSLRHEMGVCLSPASIDSLVAALDDVRNNLSVFKESISAVKNQVVFPPSFHKNGMDYILQQLQ